MFTLDVRAGRFHEMEYTPDGQTLAEHSSRHGLRFWDLTTGAVRGAMALLDLSIAAMAYSLDGRFFAFVGMDQPRNTIVSLWDNALQAVRYVYTCPDASAPQSVVFSRNGEL